MADPNPYFIEISDDENEPLPMDDGSELPVPVNDVGDEENNGAGEQNNEYGEYVNELFEYDSIVSDSDSSESDDDNSCDPDYALYLAELVAASAAENLAGVAGGAEPGAAVEEVGEKRRRTGEPGTSSSDGIGSAEGSQGRDRNRSEIDGLVCPICLDAWTNDGDHRICCLPCGHIYGLSCISIWLLRKNCGKCPQCNRKCKLKDVRRLFVSRVASVDEESQKRIRALEDQCASLEKEVTDCRKKEAEWAKKLQVVLRQVKVGTPLEDIPVHDLEASSSQDYESAIRLIVEELVAEKSCRKAEAELAAEVEASRPSNQRFLSWQQSWLQYWDQVMHQLHAHIPDVVIPPMPALSRFSFTQPETQPNSHAEDEGRTSSFGLAD